MLKEDFVCGYRDIEHEKWAGASGRHNPNGHAVDTSNGAGPHNIQMFVLAPDGTVLTCLPGYWCPEDLASELALSKQLNAVWQNRQLTYAQKCELFQKLQVGHLCQHSAAERQRSQMQFFDVRYEAGRRSIHPDIYDRHAKHKLAWSTQAVKTTDVIMHERMARQPFLPYDEFNVQALCDYGQPMYDKREDKFAGNIGNYHPGGDFLKSLSDM